MKKAKYWLLILFISLLFSLFISDAMETGLWSETHNVTSYAPGYFIIHWPVNGEFRVYFDDVFVGKIETNSIAVSIKDPDFPTEHHYNIVFENSTVFSDTLPRPPSPGEFQDIYPNLIQITPPNPFSNKTNRTYIIHWPEDGTQVYLDGVSEGYQIHNSQFTIDIPGNAAGFPRSVTLLPPTTGYEKGPFPINIIPPKGGQLDYYPYWELSLSNNITLFGNTSDSTKSTIPIWADHLGFGGVLASSSGDGHFIVAGSDMGIVRLYDNVGNILWTYQVPGKSVGYVKISNDGSLLTAAYYNPSPNPAQGGNRIIRFDRNGSVIWEIIPDDVLRSVSASDDGSYLYASWGNELLVLDNQGVVIARVNLSEPVGLLDASGDGTTCMAASYPNTFGKIYVIDHNGTILFTSPDETTYTGMGISYDGEQNAALDDHTLYAFSPDGRSRWNFTSGPQFKSVSVSPNGNHIAAGSQYYLRMFDRTGSPEWHYENTNVLPPKNKEWITSISLSKDGEFSIAGISDKIVLFNKTGHILWQYSSPEWIQRVVSNDDGNFFTATTQSYVFFFNNGGNATVINEAKIPANRDYPYTLSSAAVPYTPKPTSLSYLAIIGALLCISIIALISKKNQNK